MNLLTDGSVNNWVRLFGSSEQFEADIISKTPGDKNALREHIHLNGTARNHPREWTEAARVYPSIGVINESIGLR